MAATANAAASRPVGKGAPNGRNQALRPGPIAVHAARCREAAMLLKQASDPTRLRILLLLAEGERNVGELCAALGQSQPATSHHLALLAAARLIEAERRGKHRYYTLTAAGRGLASVAAAVAGG